MTLAALQEVLIDCCTADDARAALSAAQRDHPDLRQWLQHVDPEGLHLTSLLVKKLRFERILRGDPKLRDAFAQNPQGFTMAFRRYLAAVPPTAIFPQDEARRFRGFLADRPD